MGLTVQSVGLNAVEDDIKNKITKDAKIIALAGNPNVGKSTIFNKLTGLKQHTGNWPGKTVTNAVGEYKSGKNHFAFVDIPGTYSLIAHSAEEEVSRDFLLFGNPDLAVVVCDATCLERNLNLVLQVSEICPKVVVCVNLLDEAEKKGICINLELLSKKLGLPVVGTSAQKGRGLNNLIDAIKKIEKGDFKDLERVKISYPAVIEKAIKEIEEKLNGILDFFNNRWIALRILENDVEFMNKLEEHFGFSINQNPELKSTVQKAKNTLLKVGIDEINFKFGAYGVNLTVDFANLDYNIGLNDEAVATPDKEGENG